MPGSLVTRLTATVALIITLAFAAWVVIVDRSTRATFVEVEMETRVRPGDAPPGFVIVERDERVVRRARGVDPGAQFAGRLWQSAAWWLAAVVAAAIATTVWVMRRALVPIERLTRAARALQRGQTPERVPSAGLSEFTDLAEAFNAAVEAIAGTERLRRQVIADVGHELRTPVTNLKAQLEALQQGLIAADAGVLAVLQAETRQLERVVEDFQQLAATDAGQVRLNLQRLPLRDALTAMVAPLAEAAGAAWRVTGSEDLHVVADEDRLRQIVVNLMENAARHGPAGLAIDVSVRAAGHDRAAFVFSDNGPGIADEDVPHIFERFYRADKSRSRVAGGSGLGLAITRGLVEVMGGSIRYEPVEGAGATFVVTLPRS
jgi:two-component system sensor histidine kinase BaeS